MRTNDCKGSMKQFKVRAALGLIACFGLTLLLAAPLAMASPAEPLDWKALPESPAEKFEECVAAIG